MEDWSSGEISKLPSCFRNSSSIYQIHRVANKNDPRLHRLSAGRRHLLNSKRPVLIDPQIQFKDTFIYDKYCYILEKHISEDRRKTLINLKIVDIISKKVLTRQSVNIFHNPHVSNFSTGIFLLDSSRIGYRFNYLTTPGVELEELENEF